MAAPYTALAGAATGSNSKFRLPTNFNFNDLANYDEGRRNEFANNVQTQLAKRRAELSSALTDQGNALFQRANPGILEDLNNRGVFSSPTAIATAQGNALRDIGISNQNYLNDFDTSATAAELSAQQDALDSPLDIRKSQLESQIQAGQANSEQALAEKLAKQNSRNQLTNSLIGAGSSLLGPALGKGGAFSSLFGGGGAGANAAAAGIPATGGAWTGALGGTAATGVGAPASTLFPGGLGTVGTGTASGAVPAGSAGLGLLGSGAALAGAGYGASVLDKAMTPTLNKKLGASGGAAARFFLNPVGSQINFAKNLVHDPGGTLSRAIGRGGSGQSSWQSGNLDVNNTDPDELATTLGTRAGQIGYDSNKKGSFGEAYDNALQSLNPDQLVKRYSTLNDPANFNTALDQRNKKLFDQMSQQLGRQPTSEEYWTAMNRPGF